MAILGEMNTLTVVKSLEFGVYLDGQDLGEILLPRKQVPEDCQIGDQLDVFLYHDTENRLIATIQRPLATIGEIGFMKVTAVTAVGAFLEWGIPKNLFVPFSEQQPRMNKGESHLVAVYYDEKSQRITGSARLNKFIGKEQLDLVAGQEVDIIVAKRTPAGFKVVVADAAWGLVYHSDIFQSVTVGQRLTAYIKAAREDGRFDLLLQKPGYEKVPDVADTILDALRAHGGFLPVSDDSPPAEIQRLFGISKKTFKKALGALYKSRFVTIQEDGIALTPTTDVPGSQKKGGRS
jgi:hypothetical protein